MHDNVIDSTDVYKLSKLYRVKDVFYNIIKFLGNLLFIFIVGIIIVMLVYSVYTKKNGLKGHAPLIGAYVIITPSMVPTINVQDAVIVYRPDYERLSKGDIITFSSTDARYSGLTVTHRIMRVVADGNKSRSFKTKGDNNTTADDALVNKENIYGKVIFVIPWLGYLQYFLTKSYGWILMIVLPCVIIIIYDILKLIKALKSSKVTSKVKFKDIAVLDVDDDNSSQVVYDTDDLVDTKISSSVAENDSDIEIL